MKTILLTKGEQAVVSLIAKMKTDLNKNLGRHYNWGSQDPYDIDLQGFGAEFAFCKLFNCFPDFSIEGLKAGYDCKTGKGKKVDVKWTKNKDGQLLVKKKKTLGTSDMYVLISGRFPEFLLIGYATEEMVFGAKTTNYGYGDNYTVEQEELIKF